MAENEAAEQETENSPTQLPDVQSEQIQVEPVVVAVAVAAAADEEEQEDCPVCKKVRHFGWRHLQTWPLC